MSKFHRIDLQHDILKPSDKKSSEMNGADTNVRGLSKRMRFAFASFAAGALGLVAADNATKSSVPFAEWDLAPLRLMDTQGEMAFPVRIQLVSEPALQEKHDEEERKIRLRSAIERKIDAFLSGLTPEEVIAILSCEDESYLKSNHPEKYTDAVEFSMIMDRFPEELKNCTEHLCEEIKSNAQGQGAYAELQSFILTAMINEQSLREKLDFLKKKNTKNIGGDSYVPFPGEFNKYHNAGSQIALGPQQQ